MKVGDLVAQRGWKADGLGIITALRAGRYATVLWPGGEVDMLLSDLEAVSESR